MANTVCSDLNPSTTSIKFKLMTTDGENSNQTHWEQILKSVKCTLGNCIYILVKLETGLLQRLFKPITIADI